MKHKKFHIILFFFLIWSFSFSQQYTNYTTQDGLPSNHVYTIVQDAKGFIWFLTDKGMTRFNGAQLKTFTTKNGLPNNDVWDAFTAPNGNIWYLSKSTKLGYIKKDSVFSFYNSNKESIINPIYSSQVGDSIYPTETKKSFFLKDDKWISQINLNSKKTNQDWIKIRQNHVAYLAFTLDQRVTLYTKDLKKIKSIKTKDIYGRVGARGQLNDSLFFWATNKNYSILNLNTKSFRQFKFKDVLAKTEIKYPRINLVGDDLQISGSGFVAKLNSDFKIVNPFYFPEHIQSHFGFIDKLNNIWLATFNNGVYKLSSRKKEVVYKFSNQKVQSFNVINNNLIVGVYKKGFFKYNSNTKTFNSLVNKEDYIYEASYINETNTNYYAFKNAIVKSNAQDKYTELNLEKVFNASNYANELGRKFVYFNNKIYGNFAFGINSLDPETLHIEKEFTQKGCNDIITFNNRLLIATTSGLKELKSNALTPVILENNKFTKSILNIKVLDAKHLLINTDGFGAYITDLQTICPLQPTEYLIVEDAYIENKALWLATNSGVLKFIKNNEIFQFEKRFTKSDGLPTNHITSIFVDNNNLIVGTNNGIAILPKDEVSIPQLLDVYIDKANYNDKVITSTNSTFKYVENNNVNFTVSKIDFSEDDTNFSYEYKLEPVQKQWTSSKFKNFNFNDLQPGDYTFYIKSQEIEKSLSFKIKPLWYQMLWVRLLAVLLSILLVVYISRYFVKRTQFKKNQKIIEDKRLSELQLKALRSQMNPHFVFNSLAAIQYYINNNQMEASETYLVKFSKLIRQFFEWTKETNISIEDEVKLLKNYLDIEKLRFKDKFEYTINIDANLDRKLNKLPTMLLQPIVENAINHGIFNKENNGEVTINFKCIDNKSFKVEIIDDGVGFVNTTKKGNRKVKSSHVLEDRLRFLNKSGQWTITYSEKELHSNLKDKGNISTFIINQI